MDAEGALMTPAHIDARAGGRGDRDIFTVGYQHCVDLRPRKTTVRFATQPFLRDSHHEHHGPLRAATVGNWRSRNRNSITSVGVRF
jgi:hypothetical protein